MYEVFPKYMESRHVSSVYRTVPIQVLITLSSAVTLLCETGVLTLFFLPQFESLQRVNSVCFD